MCIYSPMPHTLSYCALIGKCALIRSNTVMKKMHTCVMVNYSEIKQFDLQCSNMSNCEDRMLNIENSDQTTPLRTDGWMSSFYVLFNSFQSYQDDLGMIMKTVCNGTLFTVGKSLPQAGLKPRDC